MFVRRCSLLAIVVTLGCLALSVSESAAQDTGRGGRGKAKTNIPSLNDVFVCPKCNKDIPTSDGSPPAECPFCKAKFESTLNADGTYKLTVLEVEENKFKKPLLIGGGILLVVGLIGVALKYTVFAPAKPKKKKKRRDDDDDDRPRKRRKPVLDDDEDDRPKRKKPRVIEEDDDD